MPLPKGKSYTSEDYWNMPDVQRAELIGGQLYDMAPPIYMHQKLVSAFTVVFSSHIKSKGVSCDVISAPFAVNLDADDETYVEPDLSIICDKISDRGCEGAPDFIIEVVSPSSRRMDYNIKNAKYAEALNGFVVDFERDVKSDQNYKARRMTLQKLSESFLADTKPEKGRDNPDALGITTRDCYQNTLKLRILPNLGHIKISEINASAFISPIVLEIIKQWKAEQKQEC